MRNFTRISWFKSWFDSPYYNLLYGNRNEQEASNFIERIVTSLNIPVNARILDLACGRGRHAKYLATKGFNVIGIDLSEARIQEAKQFEEANKLQFHVHDMRQAFPFERFDYIFNCFTSFGYFETEQEHLQSLQHIADSLQEGGLFVIDFFNAVVVEKQLPAEVSVQHGSIQFVIKKKQQGAFVVKNISLRDAGQNYHFEELVRLFKIEDFTRLLAKVDLQIIASYGDYNLDTYQADKSPRLILVAQKT